MPDSWSSNTDIENFSINVDFLKKHRVAADAWDPATGLVCFSHVPKTAGSSLENILFKNHQANEVLHINAPDLNRYPGLIELKKQPPKLICGHHPMHGRMYQLLPAVPIFHITMLRNPVDRVLSYYNYVLGKHDHPMHTHAQQQTLTEFIQSQHSPELVNGQCRRFSGYLHGGQADDNTLYQTAKDTLRHCFSLVMTTELFDSSLLLLKNRLGLTDVFYARSNVSKPFRKRADLSVEELALIQLVNQADQRLFEWADAQCQTRIKQTLGASDLELFRARNAKWLQLLNP